MISIEMNVQSVSFRIEQPRTGLVRAREVLVRDAQVNPHDVTDDVRLVLGLEATFIAKQQIIRVHHVFVLF